MSNGDRHPGFPEMVVGPRSYPSRLQPTPCHNRSIVVQLSPAAALRSVQGNPRLLTNRIADAKDWFPGISEIKEKCSSSGDERDACAILDSYFKELFGDPWVELTDTKRRILDLLDTTYDFRRLEEGIDELQLSTRHVRRLFSEVTGLSPSLYLRIRRMEQVLSDFHRNPNIDYLTKIYGFYDQPHFIREFKRFTGVRPRQFLKDMEEEELRTVHHNLSLQFFTKKV
jgi:AraC-like DNA-binding protein